MKKTVANLKKYSTYWYRSNKGDRQAILNLIGEFATSTPLIFHLRKDGAIGRIRVLLNRFSKNGKCLDMKNIRLHHTQVLKDHMWVASPQRDAVYPGQYRDATQIKQLLRITNEDVYNIRKQYNEYVVNALFDPLTEKANIFQRFSQMYAELAELTRTTPSDYCLTNQKRPWTAEDYLQSSDGPINVVEQEERTRPLATYDHPVM